MSTIALDELDRDQLEELTESLIKENRQLRAKTDNRKKLGTIEVQQIRKLYASGLYSQAEIADDYGVNPATVSRIVNGTYHSSV